MALDVERQEPNACTGFVTGTLNMQQTINYQDAKHTYAGHGYYRVGDKFYYSKINALREASQTGIAIKWEFGYQQYSEQAKKPRLGISLRELYRFRAQQLRDNYDYLILAYSGGADSDNILKTFVNNKIHLDEVFVEQPFKLLEANNYQFSLETDSWNIPSEWHAVIKPELESLANTNPEIVINVVDASADAQEEDQEDTASILSVPVTYINIKRWRKVVDRIAELEAKHPRVAVIIGIDKCAVGIVNNEYGFMLSDRPTNVRLPQSEYFYWTPDMPEIVTEQAHAVWDYLHANPKLLMEKFKMGLGRDNKTNWLNRKTSWDEIIKRANYPDWDFSKHQVDKASLFKHQWSSYINNFQDQRFIQSFTSNWRNAFAGLDPKVTFYNGKDGNDDYVGFINFHALGKLGSTR